MKHTVRTIIALAIVLFNSSQVAADPIGPGPTAVETGRVASLTVSGASAEQQTKLNEALDRFDRAGLELPPLLVGFYDSEEPCKGNAGYYWSPQPDQPQLHRIAICHQSSTIILHELAHAWDRHNTTEETRQAFGAHWGLKRWNDPGDDWYDRASERAGDTIAFALGWESATANVNTLKYICGYEVLTGQPIPEAHQQACATTPGARYLADSEVRPPLSS